MAVKLVFNGPVEVGETQTVVAYATGLDLSRFTVRVRGESHGIDSYNVDFTVTYKDGDSYSADGVDISEISGIDGTVDINVAQAFDMSSRTNCGLVVAVTADEGSLVYIKDVTIEDYRRCGEWPPLPDTSWRRGISFNIERLVPRFLLADRNGYALAKAIERAFQIVAEAAHHGIEIIKDPYKMPEWRLDELARELGCLYDNNGTLEQKRYWIINATYLYSVYGTPQAIYNFLEGYFQTVQVEENWEYGGDPFHFRVTVSGGDYSADKIAWAQKAIMNVKNLRSVLDDVTIDNSAEIIVTGGFDWFPVPYFFDPSEITSGNGIETWLNAEDIDIDPARTDEARTDEGVTI